MALNSKRHAWKLHAMGFRRIGTVAAVVTTGGDGVGGIMEGWQTGNNVLMVCSQTRNVLVSLIPCEDELADVV